jgi:hypothetical protein
VSDPDDLLEGRRPPGLHRLALDTPAPELAGRFGSADWRVLALDLDGASDKGSVLAGFAAAGSFPAWVAPNWDALEDALRDLSWAPAAGYVVLIDGWDRFADGHDADARILRQLLCEAVRWWAEAGTPFHVLLRR